MNKYKIKITGSGTALEIAEKLESLAEIFKDSVEQGNEMECAFLNGAEWEDEILLITIDVK